MQVMRLVVVEMMIIMEGYTEVVIIMMTGTVRWWRWYGDYGRV